MYDVGEDVIDASSEYEKVDVKHCVLVLLRMTVL